MFFAPSKLRKIAKIQNMGISKTSDHIQIKINIPNPSQEPPASSKDPNEDLIDMDVLCTFKIKIEKKKLDHWYIKDKWPYSNNQKKVKMQNPSQKPPASPKAPNKYFIDIDVLQTFKIKIEC